MSFDINGALAAGYSPSEVMGHLAENPDQSPMPVDGLEEARKHYSDDEIVKDMASRQPKTLLGGIIGAKPANAIADGIRAVTPGSIERGTAHTMDGLASGADIAGKPEVGDYLRRQINQDALHATTSVSRVQDAWHDGRYWDLTKNIPGAVGEQVPALTLGLLGAGAGGGLGAAAGLGAVGRFAVGAGADGLIGIATQAGDIAKARAKADGRETPNDADIAVAVGSSGVIGALGRIGLGGSAGGALASTVKEMLGRGAAGKVATGVGSMAVHGTADAAGSAILQAAETGGTQQGLTINPDALATQAIVGAGARGALGATHQVVDIASGQARTDAKAVQAAKDRVDYQTMTPEEQNTVGNNAAAFSTLQAQKAAATQNPAEATTYGAARTAKSTYANDLGTHIDGLESGGYIEKAHADSLRSLVSDAANSQKVVDTKRVNDVVDPLNLSDATKQGLKDSVNQVDMLASAGIKSRDQSSLGRIAGVLGGAAGISLVPSHPFLGAQAGSAAGATMGNKVASVLGLTSPPLIREGSRAVSMLEANGVEVPQTRKGLLDAVSQSQDVLQSQAKLLGLNPENYGFSASEQRAMAKDSANAETKRQNEIDAGFKANDASKGAADATAAAKSAAFDKADLDRQSQVDAGFKDMEAQQRIEGQSDKLDRMRASQTTKDQIKGFLADQAATKAAQDTRATQEAQIAADGDRQFARGQTAMSQVQTTTENAGLRLDRVGDRQEAQGEIARQTAPGPRPVPTTAPEATPVAQPATPAPSASVAAPVAQPASAAPSGLPEAQNAIGPRGGPVPLGGLHPNADTLPTWVYGIGNDLSTALHTAGDPKKINPAMEAEAAVNALHAKGDIDTAMRDAILAHRGDLLKPFYNWVRNEALVRHGIDRRTFEAQQSQRPPMAIAAE